MTLQYSLLITYIFKLQLWENKTENTSLSPFAEIWEFPELLLPYCVFGCLPSLLLCLSCTFLCSYHTCLEGNLLALNHQQNSCFLFLKDNWAKVMPSCSCMIVQREVKDQLKVICCDEAFSRGSPKSCWVIFPSQSKALAPPTFFFFFSPAAFKYACYAVLWQTDAFLLWPEMNVRIELVSMKKSFVWSALSHSGAMATTSIWEINCITVYQLKSWHHLNDKHATVHMTADKEYCLILIKNIKIQSIKKSKPCEG